MILPYQEDQPYIHQSVFIADGAVVSGDVRIDAQSSVWYNTVIRGDVAPTRIGKQVNIQDNSTLHQSPGQPLILEDGVTVGHQVILHSAHVKKGALIGMGSIVLDGAIIGEEAMVGAGTLIPPGKTVPPRTLVVGSPFKILRELTRQDLQEMNRIRHGYVEKAQIYKKMQQEPNMKQEGHK